MDAIIYKMKQSIFAILIFSTLLLQTHAVGYSLVESSTTCPDYFQYFSGYIISKIGSNPVDTLAEQDANCALLVDYLLNNPDSAVTSGDVQRSSGNPCSQNACNENEVANGNLKFSSAGNQCLVCTSDNTSVNAAYNLMKVELVLPDFYEVSDPETSPKADSLWETQDVDCGDGQFVSLDPNTGVFTCVGCDNPGQSGFYSEYSVARTTGTGVKHGKCCINGHHKVCQQLLNSYKTKCSDDDDDKGHAANRECSA